MTEHREQKTEGEQWLDGCEGTIHGDWFTLGLISRFADQPAHNVSLRHQTKAGI